MKKITNIVLLVMVVLSCIFTGCNNIESQNVLDLNEYIGKYEYFEHYEPNINMSYYLDIFKKDGQFWGELEIDGFQTYNKILTTFKVTNSDSFTLVFDSYLKNLNMDQFVKGDELIEFTKTNDGLESNWLKLKPITDKSDIWDNISPTTHPELIISLQPSGYSNTYKFTVCDNKLKAEMGERTDNKIDSEKFLEDIVNSRIKTVTELDLSEIFQMTEIVLEQCEGKERVYAEDSWDIQVLYNDKSIIQFIHYSPEIENLVEKIKSVSPIEVNMRGFA